MKILTRGPRLLSIALVAALSLAACETAQAVFVPTDIASLQSWIDPAATGNLTIDGTGHVPTLVDSKNGTSWSNVFSGGTASTGPLYNATALNGHPGLVHQRATGQPFSETALQNNASSLGLSATSTQLHFFGVAAFTASSPINDTLWSTNSSSGGAGSLILNGSLSGNVGSLNFLNNTGGWQSSPNGLLHTDSTPQIIELIYDGSGATATMQMYLDGSLIHTQTGLAANLTATNLLVVGGQGGNSRTNGLIGALGDMLWFNGVLAESDRQNVGVYLQDKYTIDGVYAVPEPSACLLMGLASVSFVGLIRRSRKR